MGTERNRTNDRRVRALAHTFREDEEEKEKEEEERSRGRWWALMSETNPANFDVNLTRSRSVRIRRFGDWHIERLDNDGPSADSIGSSR